MSLVHTIVSPSRVTSNSDTSAVPRKSEVMVMMLFSSFHVPSVSVAKLISPEVVEERVNVPSALKVNSLTTSSIGSRDQSPTICEGSTFVPQAVKSIIAAVKISAKNIFGFLIIISPFFGNNDNV